MQTWKQPAHHLEFIPYQFFAPLPMACRQDPQITAPLYLGAYRPAMLPLTPVSHLGCSIGHCPCEAASDSDAARAFETGAIKTMSLFKRNYLYRGRMWFKGTAKLERARLHELRGIGPTGRCTWDLTASPYNVLPFTVDPFDFSLAAARTSIVGAGKLGLRGQLAGLGLSAAAQAYLEIKTAQDLSVHSHFQRTKDFIGKSVTGTIGAAMSYVEMQSLGYSWHGHWEDCATKTSAKTAHPDFVFAKGNDICLVDAKGTLRDPDRVAKDGWKDQIYPNRKAKMLLGGVATEGRIIATGLAYTKSRNGAKLVMAYGRFSHGTSNHTAMNNALGTVQRANFISAFYLLGLNAFACRLAGTSVYAEDTAARTTIEGVEMYRSRPRVLISDEGGDTWAMRFACPIDLAHQVLAKFETPNSLDVTLPTFDSKRGVQRSDDLVMRFNNDGVGAIFERLI